MADCPLRSSGLSATQQRTVRYAAADCPQLKLADLPDLPTSLDKLTTIRQTVRDPVADYPQYTSANSPEPTTSLDEFLDWLADCPRLSSGLSATHLRQSTRDNDVSGRISNPNGGPSGPPWRTVRSSLCPTTRDDNVSGQNPRLYGGLSALQ